MQKTYCDMYLFWTIDFQTFVMWIYHVWLFILCIQFNCSQQTHTLEMCMVFHFPVMAIISSFIYTLHSKRGVSLLNFPLHPWCAFILCTQLCELYQDRDFCGKWSCADSSNSCFILFVCEKCSPVARSYRESNAMLVVMQDASLINAIFHHFLSKNFQQIAFNTTCLMYSCAFTINCTFTCVCQTHFMRSCLMSLKTALVVSALSSLVHFTSSSTS